MWHCNCIVLVLLGVAFADGNPVWFYNTGFGNVNPTGLGCSSFTREYDPYTGYFAYRCSPDAMNNNHLSIPTLVNTNPDNAYNDEKDSAEDGILAQESYLGSSGGPQSKATYQSFTSGRSGGSWKKNKKPRKPTSSRRNRCPAGQIFQSELNICIDYPSAPPLPPAPPKPASAALQRPTSSRRHRCPAGQMFQSELNVCIDYSPGPLLPLMQPSNSRLSPYDHMLGDALARPAYDALQRPPASGTILAVGKFNIRNRCKPSEVYVSELAICLPINNCYPYRRTC